MADPNQDIRLGRAICGDLQQAERREWWLANGLGAYAAGTLAGTLTRRYHGLLIAPLGHSLDRHLIFAKADASLLLDGCKYPLFTNRWADGSVTPTGFLTLESFHLVGRMPVWRFAFGDIGVEMRIWMEPGVHRTWVAYRLQGKRSANLTIDLLANAREHHGHMTPSGIDPDITRSESGVVLTLPEAQTLHLQCIGGRLAPRKIWYEGFKLNREAERGLTDIDNHLCVARAEIDLTPGVWSGLSASLGGPADGELEAAMARFTRQDRQLVVDTQAKAPEFASAPAWIRQLLQSADSFLFTRRTGKCRGRRERRSDRPLPQAPKGESVIAGYPWFGDWGRDSMIALPGLTLATGRHTSARRILETFAGMLDRGMLPNRFLAAGQQAEYNTVDAALWFIEAWRAYEEISQDREALQAVYPILQDIVAWHIRGTRYGIRMDPDDGLLLAGEHGVQLTWMDAKVDDWVVTPRIGKPVEINALWYNALRSLAGMAASLGYSNTDTIDLADRVAVSFQRYLRPQGGLYDLLDGPEGGDSAIRPNQIFAVSLPHSPLDRAAQQRVVEECGRELLTSYGLRSLSPADAQYHPHYLGGVRERDGAYHQGTVWAWLLGHYALAEYRVNGDAGAAQRRLEPLADHLYDAGLGTISEIFDGDTPHYPRGAPSQAWSVACTLEAWWRLERAKAQQPDG